MGLFKKRTPPVDAEGFERRSVRGYANKGKVAKMLADGWQIEHVQQVELGGTTLKQATYLLRRRT